VLHPPKPATKVMSYSANDFGVHDTAGNVGNGHMIVGIVITRKHRRMTKSGKVVIAPTAFSEVVLTAALHNRFGTLNVININLIQPLIT
jgi:hypothetical protein